MIEKNGKSLKAVDCIPGIIYGSCKVHKARAENCLPL